MSCFSSVLQANLSIDENIVGENATAQHTTWPIGKDIYWRGRLRNNFSTTFHEDDEEETSSKDSSE